MCCNSNDHPTLSLSLLHSLKHLTRDESCDQWSFTFACYIITPCSAYSDWLYLLRDTFILTHSVECFICAGKKGKELPSRSINCNFINSTAGVQLNVQIMTGIKNSRKLFSYLYLSSRWNPNANNIHAYNWFNCLYVACTSVFQANTSPCISCLFVWCNDSLVLCISFVWTWKWSIYWYHQYQTLAHTKYFNLLNFALLLNRVLFKRLNHSVFIVYTEKRDTWIIKMVASLFVLNAVIYSLDSHLLLSTFISSYLLNRRLVDHVKHRVRETFTPISRMIRWSCDERTSSVVTIIIVLRMK